MSEPVTLQQGKVYVLVSENGIEGVYATRAAAEEASWDTRVPFVPHDQYIIEEHDVR